MQVGFRELSDHIHKHNRHQRSRKSARELLIVSELCRRLATEDQYDYWLHKIVRTERGPVTKRYADHFRYLQEQDIAYLQKMLKHIHHWWC